MKTFGFKFINKLFEIVDLKKKKKLQKVSEINGERSEQSGGVRVQHFML